MLQDHFLEGEVDPEYQLPLVHINHVSPQGILFFSSFLSLYGIYILDIYRIIKHVVWKYKSRYYSYILYKKMEAQMSHLQDEIFTKI